MQVPNMPGGGAGRICTFRQRCARLRPTQPPRAAGLSRLSVGVSLPSRARLSVCQRRFVPQPIVIIVNRAFPPSIRRDRRSSFYMDKPL